MSACDELKAAIEKKLHEQENDLIYVEPTDDGELGTSWLERGKIADAVLDAIKEAGGVVLMPAQRDASHDWTYGWHEMNDNCWPLPETRYVNVLDES